MVWLLSEPGGGGLLYNLSVCICVFRPDISLISSLIEIMTAPNRSVTQKAQFETFCEFINI